MASQDVAKEAEKEMKRMEKIFQELSLLTHERAEEFYKFANNYFTDGKYFFEKKQYVQAFEAFIISWAYLDIGIKLGMFKPGDLKHFTVEK